MPQFPDEASDLLTPCVLIVDDERQVHASLRLRLGSEYDLVFCSNGSEALELIRNRHFDLCLVDIHMPGLDGLSLIEAAQHEDPCLGYVVLSAFDTNENLRRAIPLQVYDFVTKPLPSRGEFEAKFPGWISQTRQRRRDRAFSSRVRSIEADRNAALLERDVENVASETARDALLQSASYLTTINAHLIASHALIVSRSRGDPAMVHLCRGLEEARKTAGAAMNSAESFFNSAYGTRDSSPAEVDAGVRHAMEIAMRQSQAVTTGKSIDYTALGGHQYLSGLSGIDYLMMIVPGLCAGLLLAPPGSTVGIRSVRYESLNAYQRDTALRGFSWINRRQTRGSQPGISISITASAVPVSRAQMELWLRGQDSDLGIISARGLVAGIRKCRGMLGFSSASSCAQFCLVLALPV